MPASVVETLKNLLSSTRYGVEGDSMSPALNHGDQVLAARIRGPYRRGDVVVFQQPSQSSGVSIQVYIKRIIGLPQEEIFIDRGSDEDPVRSIRINGTVLSEGYLAEPTREPNRDRVRETARIWITGPGEYFVMGDQRENSQDSRSFGPVKESLMLGRVWLRYWPLGAWGIINKNPGGGQS